MWVLDEYSLTMNGVSHKSILDSNLYEHVIGWTLKYSVDIKNKKHTQVKRLESSIYSNMINVDVSRKRTNGKTSQITL